MADIRMLVLLALVAARSAMKVSAASNALKERPITKVVRLLSDMKAELEAEAKVDEEMYEKQACWCESNDKEKTKAIADAKASIKALSSSIEEYTALSRKLTTDLATLSEETQKNEKALAEASEIRAKELADFNQQEKDLLQSIGGLKGAVVTLGRVQDGSAALPQEVLLEVHRQLHRSRPRLARSAAGAPDLAPRAFLGWSLLQTAAPASGEIFGMLKQMKEDFEGKLVSSKEEEAHASAEFAQMEAAKKRELSATQGKVQAKTAELAAADEGNAAAKTNLKDVTAQLDADTVFLSEVKKQCATVDQEYEQRQKSRQDEIVAVSDTIGILTSDEAKDASAKAASFMQLMAASTRTVDRVSVAGRAILRAAGLRARDPRLIELSMGVRSDAFEKMRENIDALVVGLKQAQKDDDTKKDYCRDELNENERQTAAKTDTKGNLDTRVADLTTLIETLQADLAALKAQIAEAQLQMKKASENREVEHKDFGMTISDQRAMQAILEKALVRLREFYGFVQSETNEGDGEGDAQTPMPEGETYEKKESGGVLHMIESLIAESRNAEAHAISDNTAAQMAYEEYMRDANKMIHAAQKESTDKRQQLAQAESDHARFSGDLKHIIDEILSLGDYAQRIHAECDFLLENYEVRQTSRADEIDALNQAKQIFK